MPPHIMLKHKHFKRWKMKTNIKVVVTWPSEEGLESFHKKFGEAYTELACSVIDRKVHSAGMKKELYRYLISLKNECVSR